MNSFFYLSNLNFFEKFKDFIKIDFLYFLLIFFAFIILIKLILRKKKNCNNKIHFDKIKEKNIWLSDLIKLIFYANQKEKNLFFIISKKIYFNHFDEDLSLSTEFNFNFIKAIINGYENKEIAIGINFLSHIKFLKFNNFNIEDKNEIIIFMCPQKKNFCIKYLDKEIFSLNSSSAINILNNFIISQN